MLYLLFGLFLHLVCLEHNKTYSLLALRGLIGVPGTALQDSEAPIWAKTCVQLNLGRKPSQGIPQPTGSSMRF